jgi:sporulation protein YlmC with PRC-barrel domain
MRSIICTAGALALLSGAAFGQSTTPSKPDMNKDMPAGAQQKSQVQGATPSTTGQASPSAAAQGSQAGQAGIRAVDSRAAVKVTFYNVQPADMRASKLIGRDVYNLSNESIGEIQDLIIDNGKTVKAVVVSVGGFLGIGDRSVAVEPGAVVLTEQNDGNARVVINTSKDDLKNAPAFNFADVDKAGAGAAATTGASSSTMTPPNQSSGGKTAK